MPTEMEVSGKRVLFFTKVILTFLVISILIFLNYVDLQETNRNRTYLCLLRDVYNASKSNKLNFEDYELERLRWLRTVDTALLKKHSDARIALVNSLNEYGAGIGAKEKGLGFNPNAIILMTDSHTNNIKKEFRDEDPLEEITITGYTDQATRDYGTVEAALDTFLQYEHHDKVYLLTGIDTVFLNKRLDSLLRSSAELTTSIMPDSMSRNRIINNVDNGTGGPGGIVSAPISSDASRNTLVLYKQLWNFEGLSLRRGMVYISQSDRKYGYPQMNAVQSNPGQGSFSRNYELAVAAKCDSMLFPSTLHFAGFDTVTVRELAQNKNKQRELLNQYGFFNLKFIDNLSIEAFNKNNNAISILGFDISRKWFPIATFLVLVAIYMMLFKTIRTATSSSTNIISDYNSDDALDFLIDNKVIRFVIWVLTPGFLLFLVLYSTLIHYNNAIYGGIIAGGVLSLALGWLAFRRSLTL